MAAQERLSQIRDLVNQWEQLVGFIVQVPDWAVNEMAEPWNGKWLTTLYDVGNYMYSHWNGPAGDRGPAYFVNVDMSSMPWSQFGMTHTEYDTHVAAFTGSFRQLTGQDVPQDIINQALAQNQGRMSGAQFETWLLTQENIKQQYSWLRYGLDFQQFQTQKLQMRTQFGRDLTDAEATAQLRYHHAAQGRDITAVARPQSQQQQRGTAAVSGSVVR